MYINRSCEIKVDFKVVEDVQILAKRSEESWAINKQSLKRLEMMNPRYFIYSIVSVYTSQFRVSSYMLKSLTEVRSDI